MHAVSLLSLQIIMLAKTVGAIAYRFHCGPKTQLLLAILGWRPGLIKSRRPSLSLSLATTSEDRRYVAYIGGGEESV